MRIGGDDMQEDYYLKYVDIIRKIINDARCDLTGAEFEMFIENAIKEIQKK